MNDLTLVSPVRSVPSLDPAEVERRRVAVRAADASNRLEGVFRDPATDEIVESFVRGDIELHELLPMLRTTVR